MSSPSKSEREACWSAKDKFWECLEVNNEELKICSRFREEFEKKCPALWVKHFDRKRRYEKFKESMDATNWSFPNETKDT